ncbi:MAG: DUF4256 domain-containing protein [Gemmatimonadetes bacterium]|nr:DUF4256 domain-containing protein [Gemmatimonadota bacterium]MBK7715353.1 DUF4256 domain-containing protein [Gemmatimonadota bacterium]MBK7923367.1 DUF4256 domain-containing protein [Gemmatimonadota bacterium]MBK9066827.1 DUF4256 domain-containing protein [Gemmatimonadota bacterium]MBK9692591.1 DUF4256 domain-containing protein [Gemmatimonadota bacterium]
MAKSPSLNPKQRDALLATLKARFEGHPARHPGLTWATVLARLEKNPEKLWSLSEMERTGGEPDVTGHDKKSGAVTFMDCAAESPKGRRSTCYDEEARTSRKERPPKASAIALAQAMGATLLTEQEYRDLQALAPVDLATSSWILTPTPIRALGGALFCDRRYDTVFTYHNGAQSYYAARGFRCALKV